MAINRWQNFRCFIFFFFYLFSKKCRTKVGEKGREEKTKETNVHWEMGLQVNLKICTVISR